MYVSVNQVDCLTPLINIIAVWGGGDTEEVSLLHRYLFIPCIVPSGKNTSSRKALKMFRKKNINTLVLLKILLFLILQVVLIVTAVFVIEMYILTGLCLK